MFLTFNEYEAFLRGQAAGLIPADIPLPQTEKDIDELIFHIGLMFSVRINTVEWSNENRPNKVNNLE